MKNQRKHRRFGSSFKASVMPSENAAIKLAASLINLSESGMRLIVSSKLIIYSSIGVNLSLPPYGDVLSLTGIVVWMRSSFRYPGRYDIGIKFTFMTEYNKKTLRAAIKNAYEKKEELKEKTKDIGRLQKFFTFGATGLNEEYGQYSERTRFAFFITFIVICFVVLIAFFYMITVYLDKVGIWGIHF